MICEGRRGMIRKRRGEKETIMPESFSSHSGMPSISTTANAEGVSGGKRSEGWCKRG